MEINDFTKVELEEIADSLRRDPFSANSAKIKVQSMIDNYCEHKTEVWPLYTTTGDLPSAGLCTTCNQCVDREYINDN